MFRLPWTFFRKPRPAGAPTRRHRHIYRPRLESLEGRVLPATVVWSGQGFDINDHWSTPSNWQGNLVPSNGDDLVFPGGAAQLTSVNDLGSPTGGPLVINSITFTNGAAGYSLQGNALNLTAGILNDSTDPTPNTVGFAGITLGAAQSFSAGTSGGTLAVTAAVSLQNFDLTLDGASTGNTVSGVVSGSGGLVKNGTGAWALTTDNTYAGLTTINAGGLEPDSGLALGSSKVGTVVNAGGTLLLNNPIGQATTFVEPLTLNGNGGAFRGALDVLSLTADVTTTAPITLNSPSSMASLVSSSSSLVVGGGLNTNGFNITLLGDLNLDVTSAVTGGGGVVSDTAVLGGTGFISVPLLVDRGALTPGINGTPGVLTATTVKWNPGGAYAPILAGPAAGSGYSQLQSSGTINLNGGTLSIHLNFTPTTGDTFVIINTTGTLLGTFAGLPDGTYFALNGRTFQIIYVKPGGGQLAPSSQVILEDVTPAPDTAPIGLQHPLPQQVPLFIASADAGGGPDVKVLNGTTGGTLAEFFAFNPAFTGGVRAAVGDVNGDGFPDVVCAAGPSGGPNITVYSGKDGSLMASFFAYDSRFTGGVYVAVGDVNGDGKADIICGTDQGGGPNVTVFSVTNNFQTPIMNFNAYDPRFTGGIRIAAGDVNGDGKADVIVGAGPGGGPNVKVFSGADGSTLMDFNAYAAGFTSGIFVAGGDVNGDGHADIVVGPGPGGGPNVVAFSGLDGAPLYSFFAYAPGFTGGVRVGTVDATGNGLADLILVAGPGGGPNVRTLNGTTLQPIDDFFAFAPNFTGGLYVAGLV